MKINDMREKSVEELNTLLLDLLHDQFKFRVQRRLVSCRKPIWLSKYDVTLRVLRPY